MAHTTLHYTLHGSSRTTLLLAVAVDRVYTHVLCVPLLTPHQGSFCDIVVNIPRLFHTHFVHATWTKTYQYHISGAHFLLHTLPGRGMWFVVIRNIAFLPSHVHLDAGRHRVNCILYFVWYDLAGLSW